MPSLSIDIFLEHKYIDTDGLFSALLGAKVANVAFHHF